MEEKGSLSQASRDALKPPPPLLPLGARVWKIILCVSISEHLLRTGHSTGRGGDELFFFFQLGGGLYWRDPGTPKSNFA